MIGYLIAAVIGFIAGLLVGHNNKPLVDKAIAAANTGSSNKPGVGGIATPAPKPL